MALDPADLDRRFDYHPADEHTAPRHEEIRRLCRDLAAAVDELARDGREKSLAVTHLEEVMFWTNAAIARDPGPRS